MVLNVIAAVLSASSWMASSSAVTPTQQVISMMTEMRAKGESMKNGEEKVYLRYKEWVDDETTKLGFSIVEGERKIEELIAYIEKAESDVSELGDEIAALESEINEHQGEKEDATKVRKTQHAEYLKMSKDYSESVDALKRAIQVLSSESYSRGQAEMLLQRMSTTVPGMNRVLSAFLQEKGRSSLRGDGAPAVAAYEFQSGGIVEMLEGLYAKFKKELADVEEDESNQAHEFNLVELHLTNVITKDTSDRDEKAVLKGKRAADASRGKGELSETRAAKKADEKLKADTEATYAAKTATYNENQKVRAAELVAISKAIEIISSPSVAGSYGKHINFVQTGVAFLQLGRTHHRVSAVQRASELLKARAKSLGSQRLASLASTVVGNPFGKVIGMIEDLIARLKEAAAAEADHKAWCDEQLNANKHKRNKKTAAVNALIADIEGMNARIDEMGATIDKLVAEQSDLAKAMDEATEVRDAEKSQNLATIADAKAGYQAVGQALVILKEFYSSQASLLQQVPEMAEYKGQQVGNKGVVGMLEVIQTDFSRLQSDTEAAETAAAAEYDAFMKESMASKKQKHEEEVKLRLDKDQTEYEESEAQKDLSATEEELARANKYFEYLKPNCIEVHVNWDDRVAHRKEEIEALKEAYAILDQKSVD